MLPAYGERRHRVGFFLGCVMSALLADTSRKTVEVLRRNGCEVVTPPDQWCCGAPHAEEGDFESQRRFARHNVDLFSRYDLDYVVTDCAACGAETKGYGRLLSDEPAVRSGRRLSARECGTSRELLAEIGIEPPERPVDVRATYHEPCHLCHAQGIRTPPRDVLRSIPGLELVELPESDWCCGSAGVYNVTHAERAGRLLDRKMANVARTERRRGRDRESRGAFSSYGPAVGAPDSVSGSRTPSSCSPRHTAWASRRRDRVATSAPGGGVALGGQGPRWIDERRKQGGRHWYEAVTIDSPKLRLLDSQWSEQDGQPVLVLRDRLGITSQIAVVPPVLAVLLGLLRRQSRPRGDSRRLRAPHRHDDRSAAARGHRLPARRGAAARQPAIRARRRRRRSPSSTPATARPMALAGQVYPRRPRSADASSRLPRRGRRGRHRAAPWTACAASSARTSTTSAADLYTTRRGAERFGPPRRRRSS